MYQGNAFVSDRILVYTQL